MTNPDENQECDSWVRNVVETHQGPLLRYATRLVGNPERARDIVQDTFVRLLAQDRSRVEGHVAEWLFTVCRNRAYDIGRKEARVRHFNEGEAERVPSERVRPGYSLEREEAKEALLALISDLPANQQEVLRLKFQNGFSYKEISRITSLSVGNVGFILHTAVQRLKASWALQPD